MSRRSLEIRVSELSLNSSDMAQSVLNLAHLYYEQHKYAEAEPLHIRALAIAEKAWPTDSPQLAIFLDSYAQLLPVTNRTEEAAKLEVRAKEIRADQRPRLAKFSAPEPEAP